MLASDVNGDGKTNSADAILILRKSVGLLAQFPRAGKETTGKVGGLVRLGAVEQTGSGWEVSVVLAAGVAGADLQLRWAGAGVQVSQVDGAGAGMVRLAAAREAGAEEMVLRVHLVGGDSAPGVVLSGQVYEGGGEVLGQVALGGVVRPVGVLLGSYPNPFNASTMLRYELEQAGQVELRIYDVSGALVRRLVSQWQGAGRYEVVWDGRNQQGVGVGSGLYLACLETQGRRQVQKLMLLK